MKLKGELEKRSRGILLRLLQEKIRQLPPAESRITHYKKDIERLLNIQRELLAFKERG